MTKDQINQVPDYYKPYINLAPTGPLLEGLESGGIGLYENAFDQLTALELNVYAEGKWTSHQLIEHLIDTERIFQNRALRIARNDMTSLPGFEQDDYVDYARSNEKSLEYLLEDYRLIRNATYSLFKSFNDEELLRIGNANGQKICPLAIGFILIGHPIHHFKVLEERYFPIIQ